MGLPTREAALTKMTNDVLQAQMRQYQHKPEGVFTPGEFRDQMDPIPISVPTSPGTKFDQGKERFDLFPAEALYGIVRVLTFGANKYADRNWEKGIQWGRVFAALMRHMWSWWAGKGPTSKSFLFGELDPETKFSHLWHAGCCIVFLITYEERGMTAFDDRPKGVSDAQKA